MLKTCFAMISVLLISACSFFDERPMTPQETLLGDNWNLSGKISVKYEARGFVSRFNWRKRDNNSELIFKTPLGRYFKIMVKEGFCSFENSNGDVFKADSLESLMEKEMGWFFPLDRAAFWVTGVPFPGEKTKVLDEYDHKAFRQDEWVIRVEEYFKNRKVPRKIIFSSGKVNLKLVISEWES